MDRIMIPKTVQRIASHGKNVLSQYQLQRNSNFPTFRSIFAKPRAFDDRSRASWKWTLNWRQVCMIVCLQQQGPLQQPLQLQLLQLLEKKHSDSANLHQATIWNFNHVTIQFAICHFLLVVYWNWASISNHYWDTGPRTKKRMQPTNMTKHNSF